MKPRISKQSGRWRVERPGYGFTGPSTTEHPTWRDALMSLRSTLGTAASQQTTQIAGYEPGLHAGRGLGRSIRPRWFELAAGPEPEETQR